MRPPTVRRSCCIAMGMLIFMLELLAVFIEDDMSIADDVPMLIDELSCMAPMDEPMPLINMLPGDLNEKLSMIWSA